MSEKTITQWFYCAPCDRHFSEEKSANDHADRTKHEISLSYNWKTSAVPLREMLKPFRLRDEKNPSSI
jgi:hypothetical protein